MKRVLVTGMSGTGKSAVVRELVARGHRAIDTDDGWCEPLPDGRQRWRESAIEELLDDDRWPTLFVSGCEENQVGFHPRFDLIILLSAPPDTIRQRLGDRTSNDFGKRPGELDRIMADLDAVEPRLRVVADHEIVTTGSVDDVVTEIERLVGR